MGRKQYETPPTQKKRQDDNIITQVREYELITPLFGGGAVPGEADEDQPIRGSEIRGQLRFWWRACRGGIADGASAKLKTEEDKIWGAAAKSEKEGDSKESGPKLPTVQLAIEIPPNGKGKPIAAYRVEKKRKLVANPVNDIPGYASFPLQPEQKELQAAHTPQEVALKQVRVGIKFSLNITYHKEHKQDVEAALWAWETFGGLGARTRRGFGALRCTGIVENERPRETLDQMPDEEISQALKWLNDKLTEHLAPGTWPDHVPHLPRKFIDGINIVLLDDLHPYKDEYKTVSQIWEELIRGLRNFRQAKTRQESVWPETKLIKQLKRNLILPSWYKNYKKFPKAQLGLPIIFPLTQADKHENRTKPAQLHLQPQQFDRFASPIILKPVACKSGCKGLVLLLAGSNLEKKLLSLHYIIEQNKQKEEIGVFETYLSGEERVIIRNKDFPPVIINKDITTLQAFMKFMSERN